MDRNNDFRIRCGKIGGHVPGTNCGIAALVEKCLDERLGIKAAISLGFVGTGIGSAPNTCIEKATGRRLSHAEVLQRIGTYNGY